MKKSLSIFGIAVMLIGIAVLSSFQTSNDKSDYLYVRVFEALTASTFSSSSKIFIADGGKIIKIVELGVMRQKNLEDNVVVISKTLNELKSQGYTIVSFSSSGSELFIQTDYVFAKE